VGFIVETSAADVDPYDQYVFGPPGSGSISHSQRYGTGSFHHQAKKVTLIPTAFDFFMTFYL
jgi:hypothetical protein